jgi:hypothetical protein
LITTPEFDFAAEIKNICVKIPLLQDFKDIPIYVKTKRDLCINKLGRQKIKPPNIQVIGKLASLLCVKVTTGKYVDLGNQIVTVFINNLPIENTLIDLGVSIIML